MKKMSLTPSIQPTPDPLPTTPIERRGVGQPFRDSVRVLGLYVRAQLIIVFILTVLYAVGFGVARIPLWPIIAIIGGLTTLVPILGPLVPLGLAVLANLLGDRDWTHLLIAFGAWVLIQLLEGFWITPRLLSRPLGLKPLSVFIALLAGSIFFGPIGLLLAVPVLAILLVFWRHLKQE
jgi:predicted PurR-regulated permease PerM